MTESEDCEQSKYIQETHLSAQAATALKTGFQHEKICVTIAKYKTF